MAIYSSEFIRTVNDKLDAIIANASELKSLSKQAVELRAELKTAKSLVSATSFIPIRDSLVKCNKAAKACRSKADASNLTFIMCQINSLISYIESVNVIDDPEEPVEDNKEAETSVVMNAKEALAASHKLAKELRASNPELTYQQALKQATTEIYSKIPKKEKAKKAVVSKEEVSNLLKKAHQIAKELRSGDSKMTFQESLKIAFKQVYATA